MSHVSKVQLDGIYKVFFINEFIIVINIGVTNQNYLIDIY